MNTTIKESAASFLFLFKIVFFFVLISLLVIVTITSPSTENILRAASFNIFNIDQSDINSFLKISFGIFVVRALGSEFNNFTKDLIKNIVTSMLACFLILFAVELALFACSGILLLKTLAMESPLYAAIILSALIVTLQGLKQLKAIPKDDSHQDKIAAMKMLEATEIIKRHWINKPQNKNINEDSHAKIIK